MLGRRRIFKDESGDFNIVTVIFLIILIAIGAAIWVFLPPLYKNFDFAHACEGQTIVAIEKQNHEIREHLIQKATDLKLPIESGSLQVTRWGDSITIEYSFDYPVKLPGFEGKTLHFEKKITRKIKERIKPL